VSLPPATPSVVPDERPPSVPGLWAELRKRLGWDPEGKTLKETQLFLLLAVIIGLFSGLSVVLFRIAIDLDKAAGLRFGADRAMDAHPAGADPRRISGGLPGDPVFPRVRGSGVNQTKAAVYIFDGYIPFNTVIGKVYKPAGWRLDGAVAGGPEDPSLQMGAGIASALGRRLRAFPGRKCG